MDFSAIVKQLNELNIEFKVDNKVGFYDSKEKPLLDLLNKICPYGEVALFFDEQSFLTYFDTLENIKKKGFKYQSFVEEDFECSFNNVGGYLNLSNDTRCIVCFTSKAYDIVSYIATIKDLPVIYYVDSMDILGLLNTRIAVKNGDYFDYVDVERYSHIILDFDAINSNRESQSEIFGYLLSLTASLIDYRIGGIAEVNGLSPKAFNLMKQSVLRGYLVYSKPYEEQPAYLIKNFFRCKIANLSVKGELIDFSAPILASLIYGDQKVISKPKLLSKILGFYALLPDLEEQNYLTLRNYFLDLISLRNVTGDSAEELYANVKKKREVYDNNKEAFMRLLKRLKDEIELLLKSLSSVRNTFLALGGEEEVDGARLIDSIILSGSLYDSFNGMTLIKESGIID